jgi:hypothetical protein
MSGTSLLIGLLLVTVLLPSAMTLFVPLRWLAIWLGLFGLFLVWMWNEPLDGPSAGFAYAGISVITFLNGISIIGRVIKIAFDNDREQNR